MTKRLVGRCRRTPRRGHRIGHDILLASVAAVVALLLQANAALGVTSLTIEDQGSTVSGLPTEDQPLKVAGPPGVPLATGAKVELTRTAGSVFQICPVDPPRHYVDDFGQPRYFGGFHRHQGIDIFAPRGTKIRAPFDGEATTSVSWAGGLQVYLHGKQGFVFNAHLTRVGTMGKVTAGTVIGYVGNTGDARGGSTHDHFEWHPGGGPAVDPFELLNGSCTKRRGSQPPEAPLPGEAPTQLLHAL